LGELLKRLPIHPGRARIGFDRFVGVVHCKRFSAPTL
jgi:hypothetical protein